MKRIKSLIAHSSIISDMNFDDLEDQLDDREIRSRSRDLINRRWPKVREERL
ncbi:hypothetical protein BH23PAT1_BH23PAT1_4500 [soil metagenome]